METALPILVFLGFLIGSTLLILICGIQGREELAEEPLEASLSGLELHARPRFFARSSASPPARPMAVVVDEGVVPRIESFLRDELELAEVFLEAPTPEGLQRQPELPDGGLSLVERLESFLRSEQALAADFISHPTVGGLHGSIVASPVLAQA